MKILVISDTHGAYEPLQDLKRQYPNMDLYLHCGDVCLAEHEIDPFIAVRGNCDYFCSLPDHRRIPTPYGDIYMEHGNRLFGIREEYVHAKKCKIFLSGHTHVHRIQKMEDTWVINPGSFARPRDGTEGTYCIIELNEKEIQIKIKDVTGKTITSISF